jgi:hypothetical protein
MTLVETDGRIDVLVIVLRRHLEWVRVKTLLPAALVLFAILSLVDWVAAAAVVESWLW